MEKTTAWFEEELEVAVLLDNGCIFYILMKYFYDTYEIAQISQNCS